MHTLLTQQELSYSAFLGLLCLLIAGAALRLISRFFPRRAPRRFTASQVLAIHKHCVDRVAEFDRLLTNLEDTISVTYPWIKISNCSGVLPDYKAGYVSDVDGLVKAPPGINYWELQMGESMRHDDDDQRLHRACYYFHALDSFGVCREICLHVTDDYNFYFRYSMHFTNSSMLLKYPGAVTAAFSRRTVYGEKTEVAIVHALGYEVTANDAYVVWARPTRSLEGAVQKINDVVLGQLDA